MQTLEEYLGSTTMEIVNVDTVAARETPPETPLTELGLTTRTPGEIKTLKGVFFGPPKTGKTTVACSGQKVLLIQFDPDGDLTETLANRKDITVVEPKSQKEIDTLIKNLHGGAHEAFDWVVLDSVGFLFRLLGGEEINNTYKENKDIRRAYGKAGAAVSQIVYDLVMLPTNVIFTAHLERAKNDDDSGVAVDQSLGESEVKVAVSPMVWRILGPAVSFVARTYKETVYEKVGKVRNKKTVYSVSLNDGSRSPAGSRLPMKGEYVITPTLLQDLATELIGDK